MPWGVTAIRFVAFQPGTQLGTEVSGLWNAVFGQAPQTFQILPTSPLHPHGGAAASGALASAQGSIVSQPGRLDFSLEPIPAPQAGQDFPETATIVDSQRAFAEGLAAVGRMVASAVRLAINVEGMQYIQPDQSFLDVVGSLPMSELPPSSTDIIFQVNAPTLLVGERINRLARFSQSSEQFVTFQMQPGTMTPTVKVNERPVAQVLFDINTAPYETASYGQQKAIEIYETLAREAQALLSIGYDHLKAD